MTKRDCLVTVHDQAQLPGILLQKCNLARAPAAGEDLGTYATGKFLRQPHRGKGTDSSTPPRRSPVPSNVRPLLKEEKQLNKKRWSTNKLLQTRKSKPRNKSNTKKNKTWCFQK